MVKKPKAVVRLARKIGCKLTRKLSCMASFFCMPLRKLCEIVTSICTQLAMDTVRMIVGAEEDGGDIGRPKCPPSPMAVMMEKAITRIVQKVPDIPPINSARIRNISAKLIGINTFISLFADSEKALFNITTPDR